MEKKLLTKAQKKAEVKKQLKGMFKDLETDILKDLDKALNCGGMPEYFLEGGTYYLAKCLIDGFCIDRPYSPLDKQMKKDYYNLQIQL